MGQIVQTIESIGTFAVLVIVVFVAVLLIISWIDRNPSRRDSTTHVRSPEPPLGIDDEGADSPLDEDQLAG